MLLLLALAKLDVRGALCVLCKPFPHRKADVYYFVDVFRPHKVKNEDGTEYEMATPVDCKGIKGADNRMYMLELIRFTPRCLILCRCWWFFRSLPWKCSLAMVA